MEIVFSPPARPVRTVATVEVAFDCSSDIAVGKSQRSFFLVMFVSVLERGLVVSS